MADDKKNQAATSEQPGTNQVAVKEPNTDALKALVKLLVDATNDAQNALGSGGKKSLENYGNLVGDLFALVPKIGDLPSELAELKPETIAALVKDASSQLNVPNDHARGIVNATVSMIGNLLTTTLRDAENIASAIKSTKA